MNFNNDEEVLEFFDRLLERLHQAGYDHPGSHITFINVAPGAQYVSHIGTQIFGSDQPQKREQNAPSTGATPPLPEVLATPEAMRLWEKVQRAGYVDEHYQPLLSRTQAALLAFEMAARLGIKDKWRVFETLWNRRNMYRDYYDALNQTQSLQFRDDLKARFM